MRKLLVLTLLMLCIAVSPDAIAGAYSGAPQVMSGKTVKSSLLAVKIQYTRKSGSRRIRSNIRRIRPRTNSRAYLAPGRAIRSNSGVLRTRSGQRVRASGARPARDIGAGVAVQKARTRAAGEVIGVRRNGSVYNVKVLDRGRVRIVTIDANSGNVVGIR